MVFAGCNGDLECGELEHVHFSAFVEMLPWFAVYGHVYNLYSADANQISGNIMMKITKKPFNQISTDQALELFNSVRKMAA